MTSVFRGLKQCDRTSRSSSSRGPDNITARRRTIWTIFLCFSCVPPVNSEVAPQITPWSIASTSLPVRYPLIIATVGGGTAHLCSDQDAGWTILGSYPGHGKIRVFFSSPKPPDRLWGPPNLLCSRYPCFFRGVKRPRRDCDHFLPTSLEVKN